MVRNIIHGEVRKKKKNERKKEIKKEKKGKIMGRKSIRGVVGNVLEI
jgi:hypothetical protein